MASDQDRFHSCFHGWIIQQHTDLEDLLQALSLDANDTEKLILVAEKSIKHFQEYAEKRTILVQDDAPSYFSPTWCTSLENSLLWIAGCRPSLSIRLVYALCGSEIEAQLSEFLQGVRRGNMGDLTAQQLVRVNELQCKTIREEEKLSTRMASLQEGIADQPLALIANESRKVGESSGDAESVLDPLALDMASILEEADELRLKTLKDLIEILTPLQAVHLLVATKKLHLSVHEWGLGIGHVASLLCRLMDLDAVICTSKRVYRGASYKLRSMVDLEKARQGITSGWQRRQPDVETVVVKTMAEIG
ncbi:hypothetical protein HHK36_023518 [Tetracentron sinense]|uniref:DOG1 domain-containing protein n=1 Tax=Tetracentron sinense TaxID=13715 RepID=A0A835D5X5_TETSI|nr:hypothetical protein HHK36_023518 [Tetracentron sinense]